MELRDLVVTPIVILLVYAGAYAVRDRFTDEVTRRYFFPALTAKLLGALLLGVIYQFYYSGGDTFNYHTHGSQVIWECFIRNPLDGLQLIFGSTADNSLYEYSSRILFYQDSSSYFVVRIAAIIDLFTFSTYSATAAIFAAIGFAGSWSLFQTFYNRYPSIHWPLAIAMFFVPSLFFWGAGILKDTVVLAALCFATSSVDRLFIRLEWRTRTFFLLLLSLFVIFEVKKFILQAYIPAALLWVNYRYLLSIPSLVVRMLIFPAIVSLLAYLAYWSVTKVGEGDARYAVDRLAHTAKVTAYDIGFYTGRGAGSGYSLGELDETFTGMLRKAPAAINVALFRPYVWEIKNPLMFFSAMESLVLLLCVLVVIFYRNGKMADGLRNPDVVFLLVFSLAMAFAVGITSYNFGTLSRYRMPLLPFFLTALMILLYGARLYEKTGDEPQEKVN